MRVSSAREGRLYSKKSEARPFATTHRINKQRPYEEQACRLRARPKAGRSVPRLTRAEGKAGFFVFVNEALDGLPGVAQELLDLSRRAVGGMEPDDLWRGATENAALLKVRVFGNNREAMVFGILPDGFVGGASQSAGMDMRRARIGPG